jgi:hypothetical protein
MERKVYKLTWPEGSRWEGLEVRLKGMNFDELETISKLQGSEEDGFKRAKPVLDILGNALLSWNLTSDGVPIPTSDFRKEDMSMLLAIVNAWTEVVGDVPAPLKQTSSDGEKLAEELIPMEIPSSSHPSLSTPN